MIHRFPSVPHPRLVLTDAAFELRSSWREWIVAYVVLPSIGRIVGFSNLLTILTTEADATVGMGKN